MIEERKGISVIGMISSGKSTFLNSIFGINYLETMDNITTKFVCVIRYNPKITEPIFYHLKVITKENNPKYYFMKDGENFKGKKEIKEKIKLINKNENSYSEPKYENLFWMLEINKTFINNKKLMKEYDFYDIPGLNEYIKTENNIDCPPPIIEYSDSNQKNHINSSEEKENKESFKYIKGIFKYLKHIIKNFIFIISTESCYKPQNLEIIKELKKIFNLQFRNNLVILNKIDLSDDKQKTIIEYKKNFINYLEPEIFNIDYNVFIPLNSKEFKIEMKMTSNIKYYFLYFYRKFYEKYVINKLENKSFIEFLKEEITEKIGDDEDEFFEEASEEITIKDLDIIKKTYLKLKKDEHKQIKFGILFDDEDEDNNENESITVLKGFYKFFKEKIYIPEFSEDIKNIINYFDNYSLKVINNKMAKKPNLKKKFFNILKI